MGTTVVAALVRGSAVCLAHVGDSRISRFRDGQLEPLTEDHTVRNEWIKGGMIPELAAELPMGAALTRALGTRPTVSVTARLETVQPGDILLLTTDGIHGVVQPGEIAGILSWR
jgi:protein phosphatase